MRKLYPVALILLAACATPRPLFNDTLRRELLEMRDIDQRVRGAAFNAVNFHGTLALDTRHLARVKQIVDQYGWPGKSLVGEEGANAAWSLVQQATQDPDFMRHCRDLMKRAAESGEASAKDYAYLEDRVRLQEGKAQLFGTQFLQDAKGRLILQPLKDPKHVDERRRKVGLEPLAEYEAKLEKFYKAK